MDRSRVEVPGYPGWWSHGDSTSYVEQHHRMHCIVPCLEGHSSRYPLCGVCRVSNRNRRASGCREVTCRDHHVSRDWDDLRCRDTEDERCRDIGT